MVSSLASVVAIATLIGVWFLISPVAGATFPGQIPWRPSSLLKPLIDVMALGYVGQTPNGVEIKSLVFHLGACAALVLFAVRAFLSGVFPPERRADRGAWFYAQLFLLAWVGVSFASASWSGDAPTSLGQATLYGLGIAYAIGLAWTIESRHIDRVLVAYVVIAALGGVMCIWYFHERNPYHRPGFPLGNPSTLGACLAPAILIVLMWVWQGLRAFRWRDDVGAVERRVRIRRMILALIAAPALLWCFRLAGSRGAAVGMLMGLWMLLYLPSGRRGRWVLMAVTLTAAASVTLWVSQSSFDFAMARGATIRFRLYAWQYAAGMWGQRPISGVGAGAYPRYATSMSAYDNALDPAAFMGSNLVEHAHNELFEVLAEIGLVGGVTFVGGYVATVIGALALMRSARARAKRGLFIALVAALTALIVDSLFGVGPRLPGPPAVLFTLMGLLWAACRGVSRSGENGDAAPAQSHPESSTQRTAARVAVGFAAIIAATGAGWAAVSDWEGALLRREATVARAQGDFDRAVTDSLAAERLLLDPVRKLLAAHEALQSRVDGGRLAFLRFGQAYNGGADAATLATLHADALERLTLAHQAANTLHKRAALFGRVAALAAQAAEMLSALQEPFNPRLAADWTAAADQAWRMHRRRDPYDFETLMALTRYPSTLVEKFELLRDALRNDLIPDESGEMAPVTFHPRWRGVLLALAREPGFIETLDGLRREAAPINPQSDADTILGHLAPEVYRLQAAFLALRGDFESAARATLPAAALYQVPLVLSRFPTLFSTTKIEEAEYRYRSGLKNAIYAADASLQAITRLPQIQAQKGEAQRRPFELRRVRYLIAARQEMHARALLRTLFADPVARDAAFEGGLLDKALVAVETGEPAVARELLDRLAAYRMPTSVDAPPTDTPAASDARLADAYVRVATLYVRNPPIARPDVAPWLRAALALRADHLGAWSWLAWLRAESGDAAGVEETLRAAEAAGVSAADRAAIREGLRAEFPDQ